MSDSTATRMTRFFDHLHAAMRQATAANRDGQAVPLDQAIDWAIATARATVASGNRLFFVGNGGSAGIASHAANDFSKAGGLRALALNDPANLTCIANDYGYDQVFSKQLEWQARAGDMLVTVSSSGRSPNVLKAATTARDIGCSVLTLTGFDANNPSHALGDMNLHVADDEYPVIELAHQGLLDVILAFSLGWDTEDDRNPGALKRRGLV
jgi:D-sedoheptulose 7-phosphate isomerase